MVAGNSSVTVACPRACRCQVLKVRQRMGGDVRNPGAQQRCAAAYGTSDRSLEVCDMWVVLTQPNESRA